MHPINCRCVVCLIDRSSLGTPEAKTIRESVSDEKVARVMARMKELDAEHSAEKDALLIYGASDDLIEVAGLLSDELNPPYGKPATVAILVDDATYASLHVEYDPDGTGEWRIQPTSLGVLVSIIPARGEDEGDDEDGCPGYSDKAVIDMAGIEARRVNIRVTPPGVSDEFRSTLHDGGEER